MGSNRGFKSFKQAASRGFKHVAAAAKRGHKFVSHHIKSLGDADTLARKTANTLHNVGEYAALGSTLTGSDKLRDVGNGLTKLGESIHNVRRGALANRARQDFGNRKSLMNDNGY